jgi:L-aspartate oxidase
MTPIGSTDAGSLRNELRDLMWEHAGIVRDNERLGIAADALTLLRRRALGLIGRRVDSEAIELRNVVEVSALIVTCARRRRESRGLHHNVDFPYRDNERFLRDTIVSGGQA